MDAKVVKRQEENPAAPFAWEFELLPGQQVSLSHEQEPTGERDPETGDPLMQTTKTTLRVWSNEEDTRRMVDQIRSDTDAIG